MKEVLSLEKDDKLLFNYDKSLNLESINKKYYQFLNDSYRKEKGVVYTPTKIAEHISNNAVSQWKKFNSHKGQPISIADFCCGTGVFLKSLIQLKEANNWNAQLYGIDIDSEALSIAKEQLNQYSSTILFSESDMLLSTENLFEEQPKYDIIVSNPPYVKSSILNSDYRKSLRENYQSAKSGSFDLSIIFLEKIINSLNVGGVASVILSNKFMTSKYGQNICSILSAQCNLLKIEDFNDSQLFEGVTTYTCILTLIKTQPSKRFTLRRYLSKPDKENYTFLSNFIEETILSEKLKLHPWNFCSRIEDEIITLCNKSNFPYLDEVFNEIKQGIRTGANEIFLVSKKDNIENGILRDYISGTDIKNIKVDSFSKKVIFPYELVNSKIVPIQEARMANLYPNAYKYLLKNKDRLSQRSIQSNSTKWYEYGRRQSLDIGYRKKILIREMMPSAVFSADLDGAFIFSSGYALDSNNLSDVQIIAWTAILSSPILEFLMRHVGTQLHSGWFRLMKHHLLKLRIPNLNQQQINSIASKIKKNDLNETLPFITKMLKDIYCLTDEHLNYINEYLYKEHLKSKPNIDGNISAKNVINYEPIKLTKYNKFHIQKDEFRSLVTFAPNKKTPIHNWYKYTQGYSSTLVEVLLKDFLELKKTSIVLDPFNGCGTSTTVCAYNGIKSIGIEISPLMCEISRIKSRKWNINKLKGELDNIDNKIKKIKKIKHHDHVFQDYFDKAYSKEILKQLNHLSQLVVQENNIESKDFFKIGLLSILEEVSKIRKHGSHYRFLDNSNSVGLQKLNIQLIDDQADVYKIFKIKLEDIYLDICKTGGKPKLKPKIIIGNALKMKIEDSSIDIVITSPPYLNRNNYIAQQKAELDILELVKTKEEYKKLVKSSFRSHTDAELDKIAISNFKEVNTIISKIDLEKGNNPKIPHMICGYFDDLEKTLKETYRVMKKGGCAAFVVGNTRWGGIVVPIDHLLAKIAENIGFKIKHIIVTRMKGNSPQQMKKFGKIPVRESIVIFSK